MSEIQKAAARENGKKGGRPPKYKTAEELENKIDEYFDSHNSKENIPKWPGMLNYLRVSDDTLLNYRTKETYIKNGYAEVIKRAERRFSEKLMQLAVDNPNLQSLCIFLLKQPHNGGYTDKQVTETSGKHQIDIVVNGI